MIWPKSFGPKLHVVGTETNALGPKLTKTERLNRPSFESKFASTYLELKNVGILKSQQIRGYEI